jgi:excisionase family DNA binding protein
MSDINTKILHQIYDKILIIESRLGFVEQYFIKDVVTNKINIEDKEYLKISEVVKQTGYSHTTIKRLIIENKIKAVQSGDGLMWRIPKEEVGKLLRANIKKELNAVCENIGANGLNIIKAKKRRVFKKAA